jgi:hypothetical protein
LPDIVVSPVLPQQLGAVGLGAEGTTVGVGDGERERMEVGVASAWRDECNVQACRSAARDLAGDENKPEVVL